MQIDDEGSLNTPPQKPVLTVWASLVPGDAGAVTTPEHTALMEQSACQNRSCAPLLLHTLCWSGKACQSSRGPNRLCMRRCRPPSWCTALPAAVDTTFMVKMRLADVFRVIYQTLLFQMRRSATQHTTPRVAAVLPSTSSTTRWSNPSPAGRSP